MPIGIVEIFLLISGLILIGSELTRVPKVGRDLTNLSKWLGRFGVFIGLVNIILFFMALF